MHGNQLLLVMSVDLYMHMQDSIRNDLFSIGLTNVLYKIIAKILANRFKRVLPDTISPNQCAFLEGRLIGDNIVVAKEVYHSMKTCNVMEGYFALKLDMSKAYGRKEWKFIKEALKHFGFNEVCCDRIMECIETATFSVVLNGKAEGWFAVSRGLRQGCPMPPFLFIMAMDVLSSMFRQAREMQRLKGFAVTRGGPVITHLLYANDLLVFGKAIMREARVINGFMKSFERMSGQQVNVSKSSIFLVQVQQLRCTMRSNCGLVLKP